jgi:predicted SAM-dependent methyltransferase
VKIINLGCGTKTSQKTVNIDWSVYLRIKNNRFLFFIAQYFLKGERLAKLINLPDNIMVHDLRKGIPFRTNSIDVVYHSHVLEHLDRDHAIFFLKEALRALKPGGILRIVVPDFERLCRTYLNHIELCEVNNVKDHDTYIANIIEQMVRKEAYGTSKQNIFRRFIENLFLGDARKRGETHQWMYDRINLPNLLKNIGFEDSNILDYKSSSIPDWSSIGLDLDDFGKEYKPGSLYVEARGPS